MRSDAAAGFPATGIKRQNMDKRDFDKEAARWDEDPGRVKLANDIADALIEEIRPSPGMDVLDFGCGTGLVTLRLAPLVRSVTGMDSSGGMLDVLGAKIAKYGVRNVQTLHLDPAPAGVPDGCYDLIVSSMTLHHVQEIDPLLDRFFDLLAPGGLLCVADLDLDEGRFHSDNTGVFHFGFDRDMLHATFLKVGFEGIRTRTAPEVVKPAKEGKTRIFTVFLMVGSKNTDRKGAKGEKS